MKAGQIIVAGVWSAIVLAAGAAAGYAGETTSTAAVATKERRAVTEMPAPASQACPVNRAETLPAPATQTVAPKEGTGWLDKEHLIPALVWGCDNEWKLQVGGSVQMRMENRKNFDLNKKVDDDDHLRFLRTFVDFDVVYKGVVRAFVQVMDAQAGNYRVDPLQTDRWDVFQAFLELKDKPDSPWTLRLGRQALPTVSEGRVWGKPPMDYYWFNLIPTFDGAMLDYKTKDIESHLFLLQPAHYRNVDDGVVVSGHAREWNRRWHYGSFTQVKTFAPHTWEFYYLGLSDMQDDRSFPSQQRSEDAVYGTYDRHTVGTFLRGPIKEWKGCGTLGYGLEGAYQWGQIGNDDIRAYMFHADINYTWEHPWKPKLTLLGNLASGDRSVGDGEANGFDPLYGASHYPYGTMDYFRLSNMREIAVTYSIQPKDKLKITAEAHQFWLDSRTDGWNTALGQAMGRDTTGQSGRDAGAEVDITAQYQIGKRWSLEGGAAHFFSGRWAEKNGHQDNASFLFLQTIFKF